MKKYKIKVKILIKDIVAFFIIISIAFICFIKPKEMNNFINTLFPYRTYVVLTDSMEPRIPTYSLVVSKIIDENAPIEPDTIITFKANRLGDNIVLTHYFKETEVDTDGETYYRTQAQLADTFDNYHTSRSDILGEYVFHIPFVGRLFLFYKSNFGMLMIAEYIVIILINMTFKAVWKEKGTLNETVHFGKKPSS